MKRYIILRGNREYGPFLSSELKSFGLFATDLIWIEGESQCWKEATEIGELATMVQKHPKTEPRSSKEKRELSSTGSPGYSTPLAFENTAAESADKYGETEKYFASTKEKIEFSRRPRKINLAVVTANLFGLGVLLVGALMGAFVVKKLVDQFEYEPELASANALEIVAETLPVNTTQHLALGSENTPTSNVAAPQDATVPVKPAALQTNNPVPQEEPTSTTAYTEPEREVVATPAVSQAATVSAPEEPVSTKLEGPETEEAPPAKAPSLALSANDYKVGMFGGISGLEITVKNPSATLVSKAVVEVDVLKPNGSVLKTLTLPVENISPGGAKKLVVPDSNRGVNVRYRVVSVQV